MTVQDILAEVQVDEVWFHTSIDELSKWVFTNMCNNSGPDKFDCSEVSWYGNVADVPKKGSASDRPYYNDAVGWCVDEEDDVKTLHVFFYKPPLSLCDCGGKTDLIWYEHKPYVVCNTCKHKYGPFETVEDAIKEFQP